MFVIGVSWPTNVIVNKGTELFILAPDSVRDKGKDIQEEFSIDPHFFFLAQFFIDVSR